MGALLILLRVCPLARAKAKTVFRELVDVRSLIKLRAVAADIRRTEIVDQEDHEVRFLGSPGK